MKKFYVLVKKEIKELLTLQMILPLIAVVIVFIFIGKLAGKQAAQSIKNPVSIAVIDLDNSESSKNFISALKNHNLDITLYGITSTEQAVTKAHTDHKKSLVVIPSGYGKNVAEQKISPLPTYTIMEDFSFTGSRSSQNLAAAIAAINNDLSTNQILKLSPAADPTSIKQPIKTDDYVVIGDKQAHASPAAVSGFISSQSTFIPIVLFLVIVMASQLIATSIATEKENKTLETLLSSPVSRQSLVAAKLVGAGLVALFSSAVYLFGLRNYLSGLSGAAGTGTDAATHQAAVQLGLVLGSADYVMLGLSLFFGILVALSIALILGSFAQDAKSAQGIVTPLTMLILIPYFMILFLDLNSISPILKYLLYAIPFSHTFLAAPNLMLHHYANIWLGIGYMAILFLIFIFIAAKIFSSDKLLTLNLHFRKK
jgi:ABC-2 type transport system permease protein